MPYPTTKEIQYFCQRCQEESMVIVTVSVSPLDREDLLYAWTCPVCGTGYLGVGFGQNGGDGGKGKDKMG